jgi:hypothetical protein
MRTTPAQERAALHADAVSLRDCATRLEALAEELPADETGPDWTGILVLLARRCRVTAEELEGAAALYREDRPVARDTAGGTAEASAAAAAAAAASAVDGAPEQSQDAARERAATALAFTDRLLRLSAAANPRTAGAVLGYVARAVPIQTATRRMTGQRPTEGH